MAVAKSFGQILKKYAPVVLFPAFTVSTIYADWSHTRDWKASQLVKTSDIS